MPARYEGIRDSLVKKGFKLKEAKKHAAMIYNKTRKPGEPPLTPHGEPNLADSGEFHALGMEDSGEFHAIKPKAKRAKKGKG